MLKAVNLFMLVFALALLGSPMVFADEEAALELKNCSSFAPFYVVDSPMHEGIRCEAASRPRDAKPPGGDLLWAKLTLGELSYTLCITTEDGKFKNLYLDTDGDNDLAEEKPVKLKDTSADFQTPPYILAQKGFMLEKIRGKFSVGENFLQVDMRIAVEPKFSISSEEMKLSSFRLRICTAYTGKIKALRNEFSVAWVPGWDPYLTGNKTPMSLTRGYSFAIGENKLSVLGPSVKAGSKVTAQYAIRKSKSLTPVKAPDDLVSVVPAETGGAGWVRATAGYIPTNGKVFLPKEKSDYELWFLRQKEKTSYWISMGLGNFDAGKKKEIGKVLPLKGTITVMHKGQTVSIASTFTDASWRPVYLYADGKPVMPVLQILDPQGSEVACYRLKSNKNDIFYWDVPAQLRGKKLKARFELKNFPFEFHSDEAAFTVTK